MAFYRRHLPHIHLLDHPTFITFRLHGSLPATKAPAPYDPFAFRTLDAALDLGATGPLWLKQPRIASLVVDALDYNAVQLRHFDLHAFVVMANHVHLLLTPSVPLPKVMHSLKSITAKRANLALGRVGNPFWQDESFDHIVRSDREFRRIVRYIHENPVKAGLVRTAEAFPWSSVGRVPRPVL